MLCLETGRVFWASYLWKTRTVYHKRLFYQSCLWAHGLYSGKLSRSNTRDASLNVQLRLCFLAFGSQFFVLIGNTKIFHKTHIMWTFVFWAWRHSSSFSKNS